MSKQSKHVWVVEIVEQRGATLTWVVESVHKVRWAARNRIAWAGPVRRRIRRYVPDIGDRA